MSGGLSLPPQGTWAAAGSCTQMDPDAFFEEPTPWLRKVCNRCPVLIACLGEALVREDDPSVDAHGMWGALTATERNRLTPAQRQAAISAAADFPHGAAAAVRAA